MPFLFRTATYFILIYVLLTESANGFAGLNWDLPQGNRLLHHPPERFSALVTADICRSGFFLRTFFRKIWIEFGGDELKGGGASVSDSGNAGMKQVIL